DRGQRALGRAGALDLGDDGDVGALERGDDVGRRRRAGRRLLQPVERDVPLPCRQVSTHSLEDLVGHAHPVLLPPRAACASRPVGGETATVLWQEPLRWRVAPGTRGVLARLLPRPVGASRGAATPGRWDPRPGSATPRWPRNRPGRRGGEPARDPRAGRTGWTS